MDEIRDNNLHARIAEAEREGWLGEVEVEGLKVSLAGTEDKLVQIDGILHRQATTIQPGMPAFADLASRDTLKRLTCQSDIAGHLVKFI